MNPPAKGKMKLSVILCECGHDCLSHTYREDCLRCDCDMFQPTDEQSTNQEEVK